MEYHGLARMSYLDNGAAWQIDFAANNNYLFEIWASTFGYSTFGIADQLL